MLLGLRSVCPGLKVAASAFASNTTKRPLAEMSVANESRVALVTCAKNASGVELDVLWAEPSAPAINMHAAAAHKNANMSLNIKTPMNNQLAHLGIERKYRNRMFCAVRVRHCNG